MKLLFDHNLSHKLCRRLLDLFPDSTQTRLLGFGTASDQVVWEHAKANGFLVVTLDKDFAVTETERLLRVNFAEIQRFDSSLTNTVLEIWP